MKPWTLALLAVGLLTALLDTTAQFIPDKPVVIHPAVVSRAVSACTAIMEM